MTKKIESRSYYSKCKAKKYHNVNFCQACGDKGHKKDMFMVCIKCFKKLKENEQMD